MKNRIFSVLLAVILALTMGLVGCGGEQAPEITEYTLTVSSTEGGLVTSPGEGTGSFTYDEGTVVDLVAEPDEGYRFENWTGDIGTIGGASDAITTITMNGDHEITANFAPEIPFKNPGSFVQMTPADIESLDPAWAYDDASCGQVGYIYETLLSYDCEEVDRFVPVLATEWELLADNTTYRFKIREGVKFHEGGELTPSDVEYSFERAMVQDRSDGPIWNFYEKLLDLFHSRDANGDIQVTFDQIDNAVEVDGDWILFNLADPAWSPVFLHMLCLPWASIVDKEWCLAHGEWDGAYETWQGYNNPQMTDSYLYDHTNGTGLWKLEEWNPGIRIKLARNDDYWREPAAFENIITQVVQDWTTRKAALLAGDVDLVYPSLPWARWTGWNYSDLANIQELEGMPDLSIYKDLPALSSEAFFFNMDIAGDSGYIGSGALDGDGIPLDFFSDIDVRKGFCYAFDYDIYIDDGWLGEAQRLGSPICEGLPYFNPDAPMYSLDLAQAEEHLRAAWNGELWERGFSFTLLYNPGNLRRETACKILAENLLAMNAGFQVSIQPVSTFTREMLDSKTLPMFLASWWADYPHPDNFMYGFMVSYGPVAGWQSYGYPELDQLIKDALREVDPTAQRDMYYELQERYFEDAPSIMLCQPLGRRCFTKYIEGFYYNPFVGNFGVPLHHMSKPES